VGIWFIKKGIKIKSDKEKILFIYPNFSSFVRADYEILSKKYDVIKFQYIHEKKILTHVFSQIKLKIWLLKYILTAKAIYIWFADYHSFLPILFAKIFNKKSFLVLGGYDVALIPSLNYGSLNNPLRAFCTKQSLKNATVNLAVSKYVHSMAKNIIADANIITIYNGVNLNKIIPKTSKRKNKVLTVGIIDSQRRVKLKGIDVFLKIAHIIPEYEFIIVGITNTVQKELGMIPKNLTMVEQVSQDKLFDYYNESKIYCQFSIIESFCLALAEAMAHGCTGIVTNVGALPEVVGTSGHIIKNNSIEKIRAIIIEEIKANSNNLNSIKMIKDNFSIDNREEKILTILQEYNV
jgi:glycosyltransferase involved in cell wall biosynthesis